jgi:hypothetical protein
MCWLDRIEGDLGDAVRGRVEFGWAGDEVEGCDCGI